MLPNLLLAILGITLFVSGLRLMSSALSGFIGGAAQKTLLAITKNPLQGMFFGTIFTMLIQSSSATTVIVVAAVDAGFLGMSEALALVAGANIGTTVTAQLMAFRLQEIILPVLILGSLALLRPSLRPLGRLLVGLGLFFLGLEFMTNSLAPLLYLPKVRILFLNCAESLTLSILIGTVVTAIVQSSSAVTAVVIALANRGALDLFAAMGIALGSNIGTCSTALLAAASAKPDARRIAWAHFFFNLLGVLALLPCYRPFIEVVGGTSPSLARQIANGHTFFNIFSALVFLPLIKPLAHIMEKRD